MSDKKSWKQALGDFFKATESAVKSTFNKASPHPKAISKAGNADSSSSFGKTNFEGIVLLWFDPRIGTTDDTKLTTEELREINDRVIVCSELIDCVTHMESIQDEKIFLITSGKEATYFLPEIHKWKQIDSVFIFCLKVTKYEYLLQKYEPVVGIYSERSTLISAITENVRLFHRQLDAFNFYDQHKEKSTRDLSKESAEFLWFQLLKDVLLQMPQNKQAKQELIDFALKYYRGNRKEHTNIIEFQKSYKSDQSIHWYTKDSFLYRLVNKALRTEDVEQLHIFRFFISDLSSELAKTHKQLRRERKDVVMLYRGLHMGADEFNRLKQNVGSTISANGFFSVSHSKKVAIAFATRPTKRTNVVPVLYEIECNLTASESIIFADVAKYSKYPQEEEVLFDLGTTFQIESIIENEDLKMTVVKLIATDAGMKIASTYIDLNRKRNEETTPDILFGLLLISMGKYDQSLSYFRNLLNTSDGKENIARIHSAIGSAYLCKGEVDKAYQYADRSYRMMVETKPSHIKASSRPMTVMGHIYLQRELYDEALDSYFEVLEIREKFYGKQHLDTAVALNHIGNVYYKMKDYHNARRFYQNSLDIRQQQLPDVHLDIAASYNNLGLVLWKSDESDCSGALHYFRESLEIRKQMLPPDHNDIIQSLNNIAYLLYEMGDIEDALKYFSEAFTLQKIDFDPNDHDNLLIHLEEQLGLRLHANIRELSCWPDYAQEMIRCRTEFLPLEEREQLELKQQNDVFILENFLYTLNNDDDYDAALEAVITILKTPQTFIGHPDYNHIEYLMDKFHSFVASFYDRTDESSKAFRFYERLQFILENTISHWVNTDNIQSICLEPIGRINQLNGNYESAVKALERHVNMNRSLDRTVDEEDTLISIGLIHMILGNYNSALASFGKVLELLRISPNGKDRQIRLISKRMEQAKRAMNSNPNS